MNGPDIFIILVRFCIEIIDSESYAYVGPVILYDIDNELKE